MNTPPRQLQSSKKWILRLSRGINVRLVENLALRYYKKSTPAARPSWKTIHGFKNAAQSPGFAVLCGNVRPLTRRSVSTQNFMHNYCPRRCLRYWSLINRPKAWQEKATQSLSHWTRYMQCARNITMRVPPSPGFNLPCLKKTFQNLSSTLHAPGTRERMQSENDGDRLALDRHSNCWLHVASHSRHSADKHHPIHHSEHYSSTEEER